MLQIQFKVNAPYEPYVTLKIVGSIGQIGSWDLKKGLVLTYIQNQQWESDHTIQVIQDHKFQFKLVKQHKNGIVQWQHLPNNSNRKFKPKHSCRLILNWSSPQGKLINLGKQSYNVKGLPGVMMKNKQLAIKKKQSNFDPFKIAMRQSDDQDEDQQFTFLKRKDKSDSAPLKLVEGDIQQIYYDSTPVQIHATLLKKKKVYIIGTMINQQSDLGLRVQQQIQELKDTFYFKWIIEKEKQLKKRYSKISMHEIQRGELYDIQSLASSNSYFVFLDVRMALLTKIKTANSCLFLSSDEFDNVMDNIDLLTHFKFICFDSHQKNQLLFDIMSKKRKTSQNFEFFERQEEQIQKRQLTQPTLASVIGQLEVLKFGKTSQIDTVKTVGRQQSIKMINQGNHIVFIDGGVIKQHRQFFKYILESLKPKIMLIVILNSPNIEPFVKQFLNNQKVIFIYDEYRKFIHQKKNYQPLDRHNHNLNLIKMKIKFYVQMYGGQMIQKENSINFTLNIDSKSIQEKIQDQLKGFMKKNDYFKISRKENKIKIMWFLNPDIRLIRTLGRTKYLNDGKLGDFVLIGVQQNFQNLKQNLKLLYQFRSQFFIKGKQTQILSFGIGNKISAKYIIELEQKKQNQYLQ